MKNLFKYMFFALLITGCSFSFAQKKMSEGTITFSLNTSGDVHEALAVMLPDEMIMTIKGPLTRSDVEMAFGNRTTAIMDMRNQSGTVLLDIMDKKFALKTDKDDVEDAADDAKFEVIHQSDVKEIAGYKCKKAIIRNKKTGDEMAIYYTDAIESANGKHDPKFKDINGFLMEYVSEVNGVTMKMVAEKVSHEKVSDDVFLVPSDYKYVTRSELKKELKKIEEGE